MSKAKVALLVEGNKFNSLKDAAHYLQLKDASSLNWYLNHSKERKFQGLSIAFADEAKEKAIVEHLNRPRIIQKRKKQMVKYKQACPVYCEQLNKTFNTITQAAKYAKANLWTMSVKMETAGQFVDKQGNVYKRLKPMNTTKTYTNTGDSVLKEMHRRKQINERQVLLPLTTSEIKQPEQLSGVALAKKLLKDKVTGYIQSDNFKMAKELMDVIEQIKE